MVGARSVLSCGVRRIAAIAALLVAGCVGDAPDVPEIPEIPETPEPRLETGAALASSAAARDGFEAALGLACSRRGRQALDLPGSCTVVSVERRVLAADIAEYSAVIQIGARRDDVAIGIHRVVRERAPWSSAPTRHALMMVHGDAWPFDAAFLDAPGAAPISFARDDIDVWGVDLRWTRVLAETTDFGFMRTWGLDTDGEDLALALSVARAGRFYSGSGFAKLSLLGWSRGGQLGYTYLAAETQRAAAQRHVGGFIPVDLYLKVPRDAPERAEACARIHDPIQGNLALYDSGVFASNGGSLLSASGRLALQQPAAINPIFPPQGTPFSGLTNEQLGLALGAQTYLALFNPPQPRYHFVGGRFSPDGIPAGLSYVATPQRWFGALQGAAPFEPLKVLLDADAVICDDGSSTLDDHLAQITVPVLYVGAAGGFGASGLHTLSLLASTDKTSLIQSATPGDPLRDYGHFDIWLAADAERLWWQPMARWIKDH